MLPAASRVFSRRAAARLLERSVGRHIGSTLWTNVPSPDGGFLLLRRSFSNDGSITEPQASAIPSTVDSAIESPAKVKVDPSSGGPSTHPHGFEAVRMEQAKTAQDLRKQKQDSGKKKVVLVFDINGAVLRVSELAVDEDNLEKVRTAPMNVQRELGVGSQTRFANEICKTGLDREEILEVLKVAVKRIAASKEETGSDHKHSGSGSNNNDEKQSYFEWLWAWLKSASGKLSDEGALIWLWLLIFDAFDWNMVICLAFFGLGGGVAWNWELMDNLYEAFKEEELEDSQATVEKARRRMERMEAAKDASRKLRELMDAKDASPADLELRFNATVECLSTAQAALAAGSLKEGPNAREAVGATNAPA